VSHRQREPRPSDDHRHRRLDAGQPAALEINEGADASFWDARLLVAGAWIFAHGGRGFTPQMPSAANTGSRRMAPRSSCRSTPGDRKARQMSVPKWLICMAALAGSSGCHTAASHPVHVAATSAGGSRTEVFAVTDRPVRVANVVPNALARHQYDECNRSAGWRPELIAPVVFMTTDMLKPTDRLRYVSMFDKKGNLSPDVWSGLQPGEFVLAIDPSVVILYERTRATYFCLTVVENDEILVNLELFNIVESEHL
jgi:hypothetical protein